MRKGLRDIRVIENRKLKPEVPAEKLPRISGGLSGKITVQPAAERRPAAAKEKMR